MFDIKQRHTLIVVYKDELPLNYLRKLVETNDDAEDGQIVGTEDDTVDIVAWDEKVWLDNKKAGNIKNKVLLLGKIKGYESVLSVMDEKYNEYGIRYGWAGNQAVLLADPKALQKDADYKVFLNELTQANLPAVVSENVNDRKLPDKYAGSPNKAKKIGGAFAAILAPVALPASIGALAIGSKLSYDEYVQKQQYCYGILRLYIDNLEKFLK